MRCLVTGASGFLGSHLVRELLTRKHSVVVLLRPQTQPDRLRDCLSEVSVVRGSLDDQLELLRALRDEPVDAAFHLAWTGVTAEHRDSAEKATYNVIRSLELWHLLHDAGCKVLIGVGSQAEYGLYSGMQQENSPTMPTTAYGSAKLALGILLKQLCADAGMRMVWTRLFSAYGPADDECHMVPELIRKLLRREKPPLTLGEQIWDYLYVTDAARALCALMESEATGVYNLGSGTPCVLRDFVTQVRDCIDPSLPLGFGEVPYRSNQVMHLSADISRIKRATGWSPKIALTEGIRRTVGWYKSTLQVSR